MDACGGVPTRRSALAALIAGLVMLVGASGAYAGGSDYGSAPGYQKWASSNGKHENGDKKSSHEGDSSDDVQLDDKSDSSDSKGKNGKDCKKNEGQSATQTGEQVPPPGAPQAETEQKPGESTEGEQGGKGEQGHKGEKGEKGEQGEKGHKGEKPGPGGPQTPGSGPAGGAPAQGPGLPVQALQTPAPVTPTVIPTQAQQTPSPGGQVLGNSEETPASLGGSGNQGGSANQGGRVLAENQVAASSSQGGLAGTGFDAWLVALLGAACVAGSALLIRRTRRS
jgi:hypothetical protein